MRDEFYFPSKDGNTEIHTIEWKPEGEVKAVLQICHGMVEYIKRYDEFAEFLCGKGFYVVGNDHLGHGKSVQAKSEYGFSVKIRKCMRYRRYSYTSAEDDEEISERSVFYARTQYGVFAFASVYSDVRQGIERGDHYGRGCRS